MRILHFDSVKVSIWAALCLAAWAAEATIAKPTDFRALLQKADVVFHGRVTAKQSSWTLHNGRKAIMTAVSFTVVDIQKGNAGPALSLSFLGGTVGETTLEVDGIPTFEVGEECVVFARTNGLGGCPVVGLYHGKLTITEDVKSGEARLLRHNNLPLTAVAELGRESDEATGPALVRPPPTGPLTLAQFKAIVRAEAQLAE